VVTVVPALVPDQALAPGQAQVDLAPVELVRAEPEVLAAEQVEPAAVPVVLAVVAPEEEEERNNRAP
jgi:hypothetical protein